MNEKQPAQIFDPKRQIAKMNRAASMANGDNFLWDQMAADIAERLSYVTRDFERVLLIGPAACYQNLILGENIRQCLPQRAVLLSSKMIYCHFKVRISIW